MPCRRIIVLFAGLNNNKRTIHAQLEIKLVAMFRNALMGQNLFSACNPLLQHNP